MRFELSKKKVVFFVEHPRRLLPTAITFHLGRTKVTSKEWSYFFKVFVLLVRARRLTSVRTSASHLIRPLIAFFERTQHTIPHHLAEWQKLLQEFFRFYLSDSKWSKAALNTRLTQWTSTVTGFFQLAKKLRLIPIGAKLPTRKQRYTKKIERDSKLLGQSAHQLVTQTRNKQKLLVNIDFAKTDADYLEKIEQDCREKIKVIKTVCLEHWNAFIEDSKMGGILARDITEQVILDAINTGTRATRVAGGSLTPRASYISPDGYKWGISLARLALRRGKDEKCISGRAMRESGFFKKNAFRSKAQAYFQLEAVTAMRPEAFAELSDMAKFKRFVGVLSPLDVAAVSCILMIEHPRITAEALQNCKIFQKNNKPILTMTDSEGVVIFSVDKPRAGERKNFCLSEISQKIITEVMQHTEEARRILKLTGNKAWRFLFLGTAALGPLQLIDGYTGYLANGVSGATLVKLYPELQKAGLKLGTFDFRRIRTTMGILKWFETGSLLEMSKTLGNSVRVVLEHYIPAPLLRAWNTRLIRRFQNTLIILAAHDDPDLLEITDFNTTADLQHFIAQLIFEYPTESSPFANELQLRLINFTTPTDSSPDYQNGVLNIRISEVALGYLYAFADYSLKNLTPDELNRHDSQSKLCPQQFVALSQFLQHACESDEISSEISQVIKISELRGIHERAKPIKEKISGHISQFSLTNTWE